MKPTKISLLLIAVLLMPALAFAQDFISITPTPQALTLSTKHADTTALIINPDGTLTFYDVDGKKIKDYDPGPEVRKSLMEYLKSQQDQNQSTDTITITPVPGETIMIPPPLYYDTMPNYNNLHDNNQIDPNMKAE